MRKILHIGTCASWLLLATPAMSAPHAQANMPPAPPDVAIAAPSATVTPADEAGPSIPEPDIGQAEPSEDDLAAVRHMNAQQIIAVLGNQVKFEDGSDVGRIVDVLVDRSGTPVGAVLDCGGFMGVGNRKVAVAWSALHFTPSQDGTIVIDLTPAQVRSAPEYREASDAELATTHTAQKPPTPPPGPSPGSELPAGELARPGKPPSPAVPNR